MGHSTKTNPLRTVGVQMLQGKIIPNKGDTVVICHYPHPEYHITSPDMPFNQEIPGKLHIGKTILIQGYVSKAADVFQVNLCCGPSKDTIALHLSVRFKKHIVVRNTFQNGNWETEERSGPFPFCVEREFMLLIQVQQSGYLIAVNGQHCWMYAHRLPYTDVTMLNIDGTVKVWKLEYIKSNTTKNQQGDNPSSPMMYRFEPVYNPAVPFCYPLNGGIKSGMMLYISGRPCNIFNRFTIELQCGCGQQLPPDVAFHFDARAFNQSIVRNTKRSNVWEKEETTAPYFPFQPGVFFDMIICVLSDKYLVAVNGQHFIEYCHRMTRFSGIDTLNVEGDVVLASVRCC